MLRGLPGLIGRRPGKAERLIPPAMSELTNGRVTPTQSSAEWRDPYPLNCNNHCQTKALAAG